MDLVDKMDENEWNYHGEGNKSLVVSHVQVSKARLTSSLLLMMVGCLPVRLG